MPDECEDCHCKDCDCMDLEDSKSIEVRHKFKTKEGEFTKKEPILIEYDDLEYLVSMTGDCVNNHLNKAIENTKFFQILQKYNIKPKPISCKWCAEELIQGLSALTYKGNYYCDDDCFIADLGVEMTKEKDTSCEWCGIEFEKKTSVLKYKEKYYCLNPECIVEYLSAKKEKVW